MVYRIVNEGEKPLIVFAADGKILLDRYEKMANRLGCSARIYNRTVDAVKELGALEHVLAVVSDDDMPDVRGRELLGVAKNVYPTAARILITRDRDLHQELNDAKDVVHHCFLAPKDDAERVGNLLAEYGREYEIRHGSE
jgi:DNA-binding NtrC family response regulator